jgi:hypothetical protein
MIFGLDSQGDKTDFVSSSKFLAQGGVRLGSNHAWDHNTRGDSAQGGTGLEQCGGWSSVRSDVVAHASRSRGAQLGVGRQMGCTR